MIKFKKRPYQDECVKVGLEVLRSKTVRKSVLVAPTASGKSLIIARITKELTDGNCLVLNPSQELLEQNIKKIESFGVRPSVYSASLGRKELGEVIYATPKSLSYDILKDANIKYVLIDEADHSTQKNSELVTLLKDLKIKNVLGLTASPLYLTTTVDGSEIKIMTQVKGSFFKDICHIVQISDMVSGEYWSNIKYYNVFDKEREKLLKLNTSGADFTEESQAEYYEKAGLKDKIIELLKRLPEKDSALVFVPSIKDVDELVAELPNSVGVHSKTKKKDRAQYIEDFKNNKTRIAVTALALLAGFDKEDLTVLVDATPSNSLRVKIQKDGRLVRIHPDKKIGSIIDYAGNYNRFGDVRNISIENVDGYGFGVFSGEKLLTDVLLSSKEVITLEDLKRGVRPSKNTFSFSKDNDGSAKMSGGKFKGVTLKDLYYKKRFYLKYLIENNYQFKEVDKEFERQLKEIYGK
jgi:DNA repair protein RadD